MTTSAASVLDEIVGVFNRYLKLPKLAAEGIALWVVHAHAHHNASHSPLLVFRSPTPRCGKTRGMTLTKELVPRPCPTANMTTASIYRVINKSYPTLLIDEIDSFFKLRPEIRGILNSGHDYSFASVTRCVGKDKNDWDPKNFSTWCPKVLALIGNLPATLRDRSIEIPMARAKKGEVERLKLAKVAARLHELRRQISDWVLAHADELLEAEPLIPSALNEREADSWRPLLTIADLAGGGWDKKAREAAVALSSHEAEAESVPAVQLLSDLRELFIEGRVDKLSSSKIVEELRRREDRPWPEWKAGRPITQRQVARLLSPFGIRPTKYRPQNSPSTARGYHLEDLEDAFSRYLPPYPPNSSGTSATYHKNEQLTDNGIRNRSGTVPEQYPGCVPLVPLVPVPVPDRNTRKPLSMLACSAVPDQMGGKGGTPADKREEPDDLPRIWWQSPSPERIREIASSLESGSSLAQALTDEILETNRSDPSGYLSPEQLTLQAHSLASWLSLKHGSSVPRSTEVN